MEWCTQFLLILSVICSITYLYLSWNFDYWKKRGVKGPEPKLFFGNVPSVVTKKRNMAFDMQELYEKYKTTGERFIGFLMTRNPQICIIDPLLAHEILITNFKNYRKNEPSTWVSKSEEISKRNPFLSPVVDWKERRTDVIGGLSSNKMRQAFPIVMEKSKELIYYIKTIKSISKDVIEVKSLCYKYTIEIVADFVWGISADALKPGDLSNPILQMSRKMLDMSFFCVSNFYLFGVAPFIRRIINRRFYPEETDNFFSKLQKDALELRLRNKNDRPDFLNYLIQLQEKKNISHLDMVGHSLTVLLDAFETSGSMLYHTLFYLARHQDVQQKLRNEIMANVDEEGGISYDRLVDLPFLDQCLNETVRIITPISIFSRVCSEQTYLETSENMHVKIEPGMIINIPVYAFHHDPEVFPQPDEYIPDRFNDGKARELTQKGCFLPFGDGPRICAGMRLGQLECKAAIFEIIRNFHLRTPKDMNVEKKIEANSFIIGLEGDLKVEFHQLL